MEEELLSVEQVATLRGRTRQAVTKAIRAGKLKATAFKGFYLLKRSDVDAWQPVRGRGRRRKDE